MSTRNLILTFVSLLTVVSSAVWYAANNRFDQFPLVAPPDASSAPDAPLNVLDRVFPGLSKLFPDENDWRSSGNLLVPASRNVAFLFKDEPQISDDRTQLTLNACATIFLPTNPDVSDEERRRQALVFETSGRVVLTFSKPLADFSSLESTRFDFSSFERGEMQGSVVLRSEMTSPKPDDDVLLQTRDVVFTAKQIRTNFDVLFRFGRNGGQGSGLTIDLDVPLRFDRRAVDAELDATKTPRDDDDWKRRFEAIAAEGNVGGGFSVDQIELTKLNGYFRFYWKDASSDGTNDDAFVDIRCEKGLHFAVNPDSIGGWCVRFNGDVEVVSFRQGEKKEHLRCETLYLYLQDPELEALAANRPEIASAVLSGTPSGSLANLEPTFVRAQRSQDAQAIVKNSNGSELRADEIVYDVRKNRIDLSSSTPADPVRVFNGAELKFFANAVLIQLDKDRRLESLSAGRNGVLETVFKEKGQNGQDQGRRFQAAWEEELRVAPEPERPDVLKASTLGAVSFSLDGIGVFKAREADFWGKFAAEPTNENDSSDDADASNVPEFGSQFSSVVPLGAAFRGDVSFEGTNGTADISDSVEIRFGSPVASESETTVATATSAATAAAATAATAASENSEPVPDASTPPDATSSDSIHFGLASLGAESDSIFSIQCKKLDLWCVLKETQNGKKFGDAEVYRLTASGGVSAVERSKLDGTETTRLEAENAILESPGTQRARIRLAGSTASFRMKDLELVGYDVAVDCAENSFRVVGPGKLAIQPPENAARQLTENANFARFVSSDPAEIVWSKEMTFDGKTLRFEAEAEKNVVISQRTQTIVCPQVRLTLGKPVSIFELGVPSPQKNDSSPGKNLDVELVECLGDAQRPVRIDAIAFGSVGNGNAATPTQQNRQDEIYSAVFQNLAYRRSTGEFETNGGGSLRATLKGARGGNFLNAVANKTNKTDGANATNEARGTSSDGETSQELSNADDSQNAWTRLHLVFNDKAVGTVAKREILATGGIRAVACQTNVPNAALDVDASGTFPEESAFLTADEALVRLDRSATDSNADATPSFELDARKNVVFRYKDVVGLCDEIRYVSEKDLAILSGNGLNKAAFYRQAYPGAGRVSLGEYTRAIVHLKTANVEIENFGIVGE